MKKSKKEEFKEKLSRNYDMAKEWYGKKKVLFFSNQGSDVGLKIILTDSEDKFQVWIGSINLWNNFAEKYKNIDSFRR